MIRLCRQWTRAMACVLTSWSTSESVMSLFPRTYEVVRAGSAQAATVDNAEALLDLRTELELIVQFGEGATHDEITTLDERLRTFSGESSEDLTRQDSLADMRTILADAFDPANARAIQVIDEEFPQIKEAMDMGSIKKEKRKFRKEVEEQLGIVQAAEGDDQAGQSMAEADGDATSSAPSPTDTPSNVDAALAEADDLISELLTSDPAAEPATDETAAVMPEPPEFSEAAAAPEPMADSTWATEAETSPDNPDPAAITTLMEQLAADADSVQSVKLEADLVISPPETTAETLIAAQADMNDIAESLEAAVDGLAELSEAVRHTPPPAPPEEAQDVATEIEDCSDLDSCLDAANDDTAFEAMAAELEAAVNTPDSPSEDAESAAEIHLLSDLADAAEPDLVPTVMGTPAEPDDPPMAAEFASEISQESAATGAANTPAGEETALPALESFASPPADCDLTDMRHQLENVKSTLNSQIDRLGNLVERSVTMRETVRRTTEQAARFRTAANQAAEASHRFATAQAAAEQARVAYEAAQALAADTRREWEAAQQAAVDAADRIDSVTC